ncbi:MAG: EAL domain-containing protein [Hormoscilla sp.]
MKIILVIEDEHPIRANIIKILKFKGYQGIGAADGKTGVKMAKAYKPDLILCDIMMPGLDGYEVLNILSKDPDTVGIPFIFLTAKSDRSDMRQGMNLGADDYITKPFTSKELIEAISARLEKQATTIQPYLDEMKQVAESLSKVAYYDQLTNLPNRIWLRHQLQEAIKQAKEKQGLVAIVCLNIDRFREINVSLGYATGDLAIQAVAERLGQCVGPQDTVARLSGDEFSILLTQMTFKENVAALAEVILETLAEPYELSDRKVSIQTSIGISLYPDHSSNPDQLLVHADTARRWCRQLGGGSYEFYHRKMDAQKEERRLLEIDLGTALEKSEFELYYQPQCDITTGQILGMEALLRWCHPQRGRVSPEQFIPVAEETGLIISIGEWVLQTACAQAQTWYELNERPLQVSVNLSARQFQQENLAETVALVLSETGLDPQLLALELTETSVMSDVNASIGILQELKGMGIEISIDDFGTGYSSLNYLKSFPIDTLKIDRSFISQVTSNNHDAAIAKAIIAMAHSLQMKVIAEGVETAAQLAFLCEEGCHVFQGYFYSPPLPAVEFAQFLGANKPLPPILKDEE